MYWENTENDERVNGQLMGWLVPYKALSEERHPDISECFVSQNKQLCSKWKRFPKNEEEFCSGLWTLQWISVAFGEQVSQMMKVYL